MKENYVIIIFIVLIFVLASLIRKKFSRNIKFDFWISIVAIAAFSFLYVREWLTKRESLPGSMEWVLPISLLYICLMTFLVTKAVRSYKLMHSK